MSTDSIRGEEGLIQEFLAPLAAGYPGAFGLKDDCAAFSPTAGHDLIVKTDPVAAGVHFFADDAPEDIAWKALAVNVSDLAAKAAIPRAYLMALSFPEAPARDWMQRFAQGLGEAQAQFGMHLIGGDTDRRPGPLTISITVFGEVPAGQMLRRGTAKPGDALYMTGTLGDATLGLRLRQDGALADRWGLTPDAAATLLGRYLRPTPRLKLRRALRDHARAAMDISDGLAKDLARMARASGCGACVKFADLPVSEAASTALSADSSLVPAIVTGGDDYELLIAVPRANRMAFEAAAAFDGIAVAGPPFAVTFIGEMTAGDGVQIQGLDGRNLELATTGWDHF